MAQSQEAGYQSEIVIDSRASEHAVKSTAYLTDLEEATLVTVKLINGTLVTATKLDITKTKTRKLLFMLCKVYFMPEIKLTLL